MTMNSERENRKKEIAENVLKFSRNEMLLSLRFLDLALCKLENKAEGTETLATDGKSLFYNPDYVFWLYEEGNSVLNRAYLHSVLHCALFHPFVSSSVQRGFWDIACDIAVEGIISELNIKHLEISDQPKIDYELNEIKNQTGKLTAEKIYKFLEKGQIELSSLQHLEAIIKRDDHSVWYKETEEEEGEGKADKGTKDDESEEEPRSGYAHPNIDEKSQGGDEPESEGTDHSSSEIEELLDNVDVEAEWKEISEKIKVDIETASKQWGDDSSNLSQNLIEVNREKYDYTEFLSKFTVLGEEMQVNDDEFDYIFYTYGLDLYGNLPLVEPLEYKDVKKIKEFIIAIDTSGSVQGEKVQAFITKTYNILSQRENYFNKINVHIIQCDAEIQDVATITNKEEFENYIKNVELKGFGGTDFRPVFKYAQEKINCGEFTNLKGLIYFTDGYGTFPEKKPNFDAAFVFIDDDYGIPEVPTWAIKLVLGQDEI